MKKEAKITGKKGTYYGEDMEDLLQKLYELLDCKMTIKYYINKYNYTKRQDKKDEYKKIILYYKDIMEGMETELHKEQY